MTTPHHHHCGTCRAPMGHDAGGQHRVVCTLCYQQGRAGGVWVHDGLCACPAGRYYNAEHH